MGSSTLSSSNKPTSFLAGCVQELKKVRWPNKSEVVKSTLVVMFTVVFLSVFLYIVNNSLGFLLRKLVIGNE